MDVTTELSRAARHILPPLVAFVVAKGWIPADMQQPLVEAGIAASAVVAAMFASRARDRTR